MSKTNKILLSVAVVLFFAGVAIACIGFMIGGNMNDIEGLDAINLNGIGRLETINPGDNSGTVISSGEGISYARDEVTSLNFDLGLYDIEIIERDTGDTNDTFAVVQGDFTPKIYSSLQNGVWKLELEKGLRVSAVKPQKLTIYLPYGFVAEKADVSLGMGNMTVGALRADKVTLEVGAGRMTIAGPLESADTEISCGMGEIQIKDAKLSGSTELDCGMGNVKIAVAGKRSDYSYTCDVGMGSMTFGDIVIKGAGSNSGKGDLPGNSFSMDCGMGSVEVTFHE